MTDNLGFKDDEVIWLYQYFSDIKIAPTTYTLDDLIGEIGNEITHIEDNGKIKDCILIMIKVHFQHVI